MVSFPLILDLSIVQLCPSSYLSQRTHGSHFSGLTKFPDFSSIFSHFYHPRSEASEGYVFTCTCQSLCSTRGETPNVFWDRSHGQRGGGKFNHLPTPHQGQRSTTTLTRVRGQPPPYQVHRSTNPPPIRVRGQPPPSPPGSEVNHLPTRFIGQPTPPPQSGSEVNHLPHHQGQRSTTSPTTRVRGQPPPPGSKVNHLSPPGSEVNHLAPPPGQRSTTSPTTRIHTGTTVNGLAVCILLECILVPLFFLNALSFKLIT